MSGRCARFKCLSVTSKLLPAWKPSKMFLHILVRCGSVLIRIYTMKSFFKGLQNKHWYIFLSFEGEGGGVYWSEVTDAPCDQYFREVWILVSFPGRLLTHSMTNCGLSSNRGRHLFVPDEGNKGTAFIWQWHLFVIGGWHTLQLIGARLNLSKMLIYLKWLI